MKRFLPLILLLIATSTAYAATQFDFLLSQVRSGSSSLANGKVYFYAAGTSTPKTVWLDLNGTTPAANPYTLDANGTAQIYGSGLYRIVIKDSAGVVKSDRDNIAVNLTNAPNRISTGSQRITNVSAAISLPTAIGNPPATSTLKVDTVDTSTDRNLGFVSQMLTGDIPAEGAPDPQSDKVAGYFAGYNGAHSAAFHTVLNPIFVQKAADSGTVDVAGTAVTRVTGSDFLPSWVNGVMALNGSLYKIDAVADASHLTLKNSAGTLAGVPFQVGGGNAMEVDVNNMDVDASNASLHGPSGIMVGSGGTKQPRTGLSVSATNAPANAWINGAVLTGFKEYGLYISAPAAATASGADISNGSSGTTTIRGGVTALTVNGDHNAANFNNGTDGSVVINGGLLALKILPSSGNGAINITPANDGNGSTPSVAGTNAAASAFNWYITQDGSALLKDITGKSVTVTPPDDNGAFPSLYTTNAANSAARFVVYRDGKVFTVGAVSSSSAQLNPIAAASVSSNSIFTDTADNLLKHKDNGGSVGIMTDKVSVPANATSAGLPGHWAADASYLYVYTGNGTTHTWRRTATASW